MILKNVDRDGVGKIARSVADRIGPGLIVTLSGNLGAGKTYFTQQLMGIIMSERGMAIPDVVSPTFNIVKSYDLGDLELRHFDLYRLKNISELYEINFEESLETCVCLIEWPEIAEEILKYYPDKIQIKIDFGEGDTRNFHIQGLAK